MQPTDVVIVNFATFFFKDFTCSFESVCRPEREWEREHVHEQMGVSGKGRFSTEQGAQLWDSVPQSWDPPGHDLSQSQMLTD